MALGLCALARNVLGTVYGHRRPRDEGGTIAGKIDAHGRDLLSFAEPANWDRRDDALQHILGNSAHHLCIDIARTNGVDGDAFLSALLREGLGEANQTRFGGGVIDLTKLTLLAIDR